MKHQTNRKEGPPSLKASARRGIISISSKGTGYVAINEKVPTKGRGSATALAVGKDPEIDFRHLNTALHGDMVEILLHPKVGERSSSARGYGGTRQSAEVTKIISRAKTSFAGVLEKDNGMFFLKPDDTKMYTDILIPAHSLIGAKINQKVFVEIVSWKDPMKAPEGKVVKILGRPGDNDAEMESIAIEKGFIAKLPEPVEKEGEMIKARGIRNEDYTGRRDFRKTLTFTIDPADAKDFDDAISFRILPSLKKEGVGSGKRMEELYEIGVHIADVSHYVKVGSALDKEARERGTSVYLVDRTIPMLPEALSNDLCSLVPHKDRLTMSAVFIMEKNGDKNIRVKDSWFGRTVIHSQKRFTYEEAEKSIKHKDAPLHKELSILNSMAKILTKDRFREGAISLDQEEVKFVMDSKGVPIKVVKKERGDSNRLIEEFMLLANKKVAEKISAGSKKSKAGVEPVGVFVYRIHDAPLKEKMEGLAFFLKSLGYPVKLKNGVIPSHDINSLLEKLEGKAEKDAVHRAVIRSMAKAIYSTKNIGHYGLAFRHYTHFTSPIRRYPDIMVHRIFLDHLSGRKISRDKIQTFEAMSIKASEQEKRAAEAERASIKYKQVEYMSKRIGQKFDGAISGITEWGIYVEELETKCEGRVSVRDMADDFYNFDEKRLALIGKKRKKVYKLGDRVKVKVKAADLERKTIDYILV